MLAACPPHHGASWNLVLECWCSSLLVCEAQDAACVHRTCIKKASNRAGPQVAKCWEAASPACLRPGPLLDHEAGLLRLCWLHAVYFHAHRPVDCSPVD